MDVNKVVGQLQKKYPGKQIIKNKNVHEKVVEIICEVDPTEDHKEYSRAIAVIDSSILHVHRKTTETYKIIKGKLLIFMADRNISIKKGESFTMKPGEIHANLGNETWVEVFSKPGWTLKDHIGLKPIVKEYLKNKSS